MLDLGGGSIQITFRPSTKVTRTRVSLVMSVVMNDQLMCCFFPFALLPVWFLSVKHIAWSVYSELCAWEEAGWPFIPAFFPSRQHFALGFKAVELNTWAFTLVWFNNFVIWTVRCYLSIQVFPQSSRNAVIKTPPHIPANHHFIWIYCFCVVVVVWGGNRGTSFCWGGCHVAAV